MSDGSSYSDSDDDLAAMADLQIFSPDEIMQEGLRVAGFRQQRIANAGIITNIARFKAFYGSSPAETAILWEELQTTKIDNARLQKNEKDIHYLLMALHFLFTYPTKHRAEGMFDVAIKTFYKWTWLFVDKMAALSASKIVWPEEWTEGNINNLPKFLVSVDGLHMRKFEPAHPTLPKNRKAFSFKFHQSGLTYEIALSIWENKVVHVHGPFLASMSDISIFRDKLKGLIPKGTKAIADQGYKGERRMISMSNSLDSAKLRRFKSRVRARQESYNRRIKAWSIMDVNFRHTADHHRRCFLAINTICIIQLDNGSPLFSV
jgi:hypothetical protein